MAYGGKIKIGYRPISSELFIQKNNGHIPFSLNWYFNIRKKLPPLTDENYICFSIFCQIATVFNKYTSKSKANCLKYSPPNSNIVTSNITQNVYTSYIISILLAMLGLLVLVQLTPPKLKFNWVYFIDLAFHAANAMSNPKIPVRQVWFHFPWWALLGEEEGKNLFT